MRLLHFLICLLATAVSATAGLTRSAKSGSWSDAATWENGHIPAAGDVALVRPGHRVTYDVAEEAVIRAVHIGGVLTFSREKDTLLCAGLIRIAAGEQCAEEGFDCHAPPPKDVTVGDRPALEVGTLDAPMPSQRQAIIRLTYIDGMDKASFPALVCCGGRMDLHGAPLNRSWVKLGETAYTGSSDLELHETVTGWRSGDHLLIPTTESSEFYQQDSTGRRIIRSVRDSSMSEEAEIDNVSGRVITLKRPLQFRHQAEGQFRGEVANLSRNVIIESADPKGERGHTMYHRGSAGAISYAEFRHLGKEGVLGRYPIHFHMCGETMRGASVIGASIWDGGNHWLNVHGTNYLVIRDCVGWRSVGHGFFFEDGTEVDNILDRNLAVQALIGQPQQGQILPFDTNDGAGFWWANCLNSFTRNLAVECDKHGYRFQMTKTESFDPRLIVRQSDGLAKKVDVRTLPFIRFEGNEAHSQRRFALNLGGFHGQSSSDDLDRDGNVIDRIGYLGGDVQGVGPDESHPFRIKDFLAWRSHWAFHTAAPNVVFDGFTANDINYVVWRSDIAGHDYNRLSFENIHVSTFFNNWGAGKSRADLLRYVNPADTQPPVTVITRTTWLAANLLRVSGVTADDSAVREVRVNGQAAELQQGLVTDWSAIIQTNSPEVEISAGAQDEEGNREITPHHMMARFQEVAVKAEAQLPPAVTRPAYTPAAAIESAPVREGEVNRSKLKWPLWDGKESVADYARRTGLPATRTFSLNGENLDLVLIPAGTFLMGSPSEESGHAADEGPQHRVVISQPYYLGRTEVTQAQYAKVMEANPSYFRAPLRPVEQVTWFDAQRFLQKVGQNLRLPTEAEWEFACRAGTTSAYCTEDVHAVGWVGPDGELQRALSNAESQPVVDKAPNGFGLHDMHGNVYEWCADWYAPEDYLSSPLFDPMGGSSGDQRVLRGGSWEAPPDCARSANRNGLSPYSRGYTVGFRVAMPVPIKP